LLFGKKAREGDDVSVDLLDGMILSVGSHVESNVLVKESEDDKLSTRVREEI